MHLTPEQQAIIASGGNIKINAVAGSGKTTTLVEYARSRPQDSRILYLAFNKTVKQEAIRKFNEKGLHNVTVETAHSLAYHHVVKKTNYKVRNEYKTHELVDLLGIRTPGEKHTEFVLARHINQFAAYFCNSDKEKVEELSYADTIKEPEAKAFASQYQEIITRQTRLFLATMNRPGAEITHDFYLKKFQLSKPQLGFDYVLFDEGQDASPAMLHVFLNQPCTKVIVGDTHQQIYGWRFAENAMEKTDFQSFSLSQSFRFGPEISNLACEVLQWKKHLNLEQKVVITGSGIGAETKSKAIIARSNLSLLVKAIEQVTGIKKIQRIYFEGNIESYAYAKDGASLYDVLNLFNGKKALIRDKMMAQMKDVEELEHYIEKAGDQQLGMMLELVREFGNEIPALIKQLKDRHVAEEDRHTAELIFTTVRRSKGLEYDSVQIVKDFLNEEKLQELKGRDDFEESSNASQLAEEINMLYVAVTRARQVVYLPETLKPKTVEASGPVQLLKVLAEEPAKALKNGRRNDAKPPSSNKNEKAYSVAKKREENKDAYQPWTEKLDAELKRMFDNGVSLADMARHFGRTRGTIGSRIKKLELEGNEAPGWGRSVDRFERKG